MTKKSGKTLTVFLAIIAILLVSLTALSIFFFQREIDRRQAAEKQLETLIQEKNVLEDQLKGSQKQVFLLQEKNKEADERINNVLDDLELEQGLREELKQDNLALKAQLDEAVTSKERLEAELVKADEIEKKFRELEVQYKQEVEAKENLQNQLNRLAALQLGYDQSVTSATPHEIAEAKKIVGSDGVDLEKIVVVSDQIPEGRILSVDSETEFVIVNIGAKDGLALGKILSVYRGQDYLGDIKITRVQPEMSAADFIPPFSSRKVRRNDKVLVK